MYQNRISPIGFVGNDLQFKSTKNGTPVAVLSVATKSNWKNGKGEYASPPIVEEVQAKMTEKTADPRVTDDMVPPQDPAFGVPVPTSPI